MSKISIVLLKNLVCAKAKSPESFVALVFVLVEESVLLSISFQWMTLFANTMKVCQPLALVAYMVLIQK